MDSYEEMEAREAQMEDDAALDRMAQALQRKQQKDAQNEHAKFQSESFAAGLEEAGISNEDFNALVAQNPDIAKDLFKKGISDYVKNVAGTKKAKTSTGPKQPASPASSTPTRTDTVENLAALVEAALPWTKDY